MGSVMAEITGTALRYDGLPVDYVSIFNWGTGACIAQVIPDNLGEWGYAYTRSMVIGITYVSNGCQPMVHGPYSFDGWSPANLFTGGVDGVYYDPSDISTLFQDVDRLIPVTADGQSVALIKDKSGNNNHLMQADPNKRPLYKTNGALHWLNFDGVDDVMVSDYVPWNGANFMTSLAIAENAKSQAGFSFTDGANRFYEEYAAEEGAVDTKTIVQRYPTRVVPFNTSVTKGNPYITWTTNGASFNTGLLPIGGSVNLGDTALTSAQAKLTIGSGHSDSMGNIRFYGFTWLSRTPTDIERDAANDYMLSLALG